MDENDTRLLLKIRDSHQPFRPTSWQLQHHGRKFPPGYLHNSWIDWLYWDVELLA